MRKTPVSSFMTLSTESQWLTITDAVSRLSRLVTEPDTASAEEAMAFVEQISLLLQYAGVCDCKMEQGSAQM